MKHVLLVDDDTQIIESTRKILEFSGFRVTTAHDGQDALEKLQVAAPDLVLSDVRMPRMTGLEFLKAVAASRQGTPVVLMTAFGRVEDAVWAMKFGAVDFLTKPFKRQALLDAVGAALKRAPRAQASAEPGISDPMTNLGILGQSKPIEELRRLIRQVAPTTATVLVLGESGTGKERVAKSLHELSARKAKPFVAVNCAALPDTLLESELFGFEKGAFTGAQSAKPGLFEQAHGGTLLLDEIGDMPLALQAKLLRVIQEGEVRRLGASAARKVDVRLIAATHRNLKTMASSGAFRQDLLFRLEVVTLELAPLRARVTDIPELAQAFVRQFSEKHGKIVPGFTTDAMQLLMAHAWPGNIRELQNVIERAVIFASDHALIEPQDLPAHLAELSGRDLGLPVPQSLGGAISVAIGTPLKEVEDLLIRKTLEATQGDKNVTAKLLGINSRTIYRKLKEDGSEDEPGSPA